MLYTIVRESPGRMRLHLSVGCLEQQEARGIEASIGRVEGVTQVEAHAANASLLVCCPPDVRQVVLEQVAALDVLHLPTAEVQPDDTDLALRLEDERFVLAAGNHVAWALLRRLLLPAPVRAAWVVARSLAYVAEGLACPEGFGAYLDELAPGASAVYLARGGKLMGALCITDPLRPDAAQTLNQLRQLGFTHIVMLTGDSERAAQTVACALGIDEYCSQVLPEDKATEVERLEAAGHRVVMVGDGINDSPALAAASVSVALADASDIARTVADVSIRDASLEKLVVARRLSMRLQQRIHSRYQLIVGFNTLLIVLGVASVLPLTTAATLHNLSTVAIAAANTRPLLTDEERMAS